MIINVRFFGGVSKAVGFIESAELEFDGGELGSLLKAVMLKWPGTKEFIDGPQASTMVLALNGNALEPVDPQMPVKDGDRLAIMPMVHGG